MSRLLTLVILISACSSQDFKGGATAKQGVKGTAEAFTESNGSTEGPVTPQSGNSEGPKGTGSGSDPLPLPVAVTPVPIGGSYLTCLFENGSEMTCGPKSGLNVSIVKAYSISGPQATWQPIDIESVNPGETRFKQIPATAYAVSVLLGSSDYDFLMIPDRSNLAKNLIVDGSFEENAWTDNAASKNFSTASNTPWSFHSDCNYEGGQLPLLTVNRGIELSPASQGNYFATLFDACYFNGNQVSTNPAQLYQELPIGLGRNYIVIFSHRAADPKIQSILTVNNSLGIPRYLVSSGSDWTTTKFVFDSKTYKQVIIKATENAKIHIDDIQAYDLGAL